MFEHTTTRNSNNGTNSSIGIINNLFEAVDFNQEDLLHLIDRASQKLPNPSKQKIVLSKKTNGKTYDLDNMEYDRSMIGKIYSIMSDGIPRTTQSYFGKTSALQEELYKKFGNRVGERVIGSRLSDMRLKTLQKPSVLYAIEEIKGASGIVVGKMRFYWMVFDGIGDKRNGENEVNPSLCKKWDERRS